MRLESIYAFQNIHQFKQLFSLTASRMQMLLSSSSLCFSVSSRASCLALSAASMSFLAVWELSDSWEPARCKQHVKWRQESEYCSEAESEAEGEIACAPASLAGCLQGSEWNVSIRKLSFAGVFVQVCECLKEGAV